MPEHFSPNKTMAEATGSNSHAMKHEETETQIPSLKTLRPREWAQASVQVGAFKVKQWRPLRNPLPTAEVQAAVAVAADQKKAQKGRPRRKATKVPTRRSARTPKEVLKLATDSDLDEMIGPDDKGAISAMAVDDPLYGSR